ncbi:hypothetical protein FP803_04070 [Candidatus Woesearchaeota archaeon]|nr:hypothetical protein [Candidatus Woesearchaeota archaeon]MBU3941283.1 hypothetical protein [Nanoarchaeota archaeon]
MSKNLLIKKINEGAKAEFIIHRNAPGFFRKLGKEGKAKVYYTPQELQGTYHIFDNKDYLLFRTGQGVASGQNKEFIKNLREDMDKKIVKYLIPPDKIDKIFDMIQNGIKSELIAKELGYKFP